jgi:hypothetical protein
MSMRRPEVRQHPLHQVGQLTGRQDRRRQLTAAAADKHPARLVDPELTRVTSRRVV